MRTLLIVLALFVVIAAVLLLTFSATPAISGPQVSTLGQATPISVRVTAPHGLRRIAAYVEQGDGRYRIGEASEPSRLFFWQRHVPDRNWSFTAGTTNVPQLKDGAAKLVVEVTSNDLRAKSARWERQVNVVTRPPSISVDSDQHYLYLGMAELATFNISGNWTEAGVRVADSKFRAWPMPDGKPGYFSLFAYPWNTPAGTLPLVYAGYGDGNQVTGTMVYEFPKKEQPHYTVHDLKIDERFLMKVVNELDPNGTGDPVARFVKVNSEMRRVNNKTLYDLRLKTEPRFLWSQTFQRQSRSSNEATFADTRNYIYQGRKIDQQVHLGYDLAVTEHVGVEASNDGRVVYAAPLGIYGNCVVVDHGYGLQTIYGHMSEIGVREGEMVKRGQVMGKSGMTGMAAGDHIHFSMQLDGVQIDPKEFWDPHWIQDHIAKRVPLPGFVAQSQTAAVRSKASSAPARRQHKRRR